MLGFEHALVLLLLVTILNLFARWLPWPVPITYVVGSVLFAFTPWFPRVELDPGFFFLCFLPPLLFSDAWLMPLREFNKVKRSVFLLATGLVSFTTVVVGLIAHWLIPGLPLPMAFALGAVISPTDAVAVVAVTEKLKIPTRLTIVLEGESLMNDATGLVAFKFALGALIVGTFSIREAFLDFLFVALGGLGLGWAIGYGVGKLRDLLIRMRAVDPMIETTLSLLTPFGAFLAAEHFELSGVLAVVAAGLYSGWRDPLRMDPESRQRAFTVWSTVLFWLNGLAFVLLGLQFPSLLSAVANHYSPLQLVGFVAAISSAAIILRVLWFFPGAFLPFVMSYKARANEECLSWQAVVVGGWAGMRGTVTLAAALSIPLLLPNGQPFPARDIVLFLAFGVIAVTLLVQGTTVGWLIRRLGLHEDGIREKEERLARTTAVDAGLKVLRSLATETTQPEESAALGHVVAEYEQRLSELVAEGETQANARIRRTAERRFRFAALDAERQAVDDLWRRDIIADEVHRPLQRLLDHEHAMLRAQPINGPSR